MAEILIKATNHVHPDPDKDRRGAYKRGMPVVVMEDGHTWGRLEGLPNFFLMKLPGVSVSKVLQFIESDDRDQGETDPVSGDPILTPYRRRLWKLLIDNVPAGVKQKVADTGELVIGGGAGADYTWAQVRTFIKNQRTNADAPETL
jgi:hypothetical protein